MAGSHAASQGRYAFGFSGIVEPDEYERMVEPTPLPPLPKRQTKKAAVEQFKASQEAEKADAIIDSIDPETGEITEGEAELIDIIDNQLTDLDSMQEWHDAHKQRIADLPEPARSHVKQAISRRYADLM